MKITLNIETNDPADLERVAAALAGKDVAVTTSGKPATAARAAKPEAASGATAQTQTAAQAGGASTAETKATPDTADAAVPSDADLIAAANAATAKVGVGGPDKVKSYIAANFKKADGSPGTLKTTAEGERAKLLLSLQQIGRGEITL